MTVLKCAAIAAVLWASAALGQAPADPAASLRLGSVMSTVEQLKPGEFLWLPQIAAHFRTVMGAILRGGISSRDRLRCCCVMFLMDDGAGIG